MDGGRHWDAQPTELSFPTTSRSARELMPNSLHAEVPSHCQFDFRRVAGAIIRRWPVAARLLGLALVLAVQGSLAAAQPAADKAASQVRPNAEQRPSAGDVA